MKLPDHVQMVMLSATVPNYREFADWVGRAKGKKVYVQMTEKRPVPLEHKVLFGDKLHLIKDELNNIHRENIDHVLKLEQNDRRKKFAEKDKQKKNPKDGASEAK